MNYVVIVVLLFLFLGLRAAIGQQAADLPAVLTAQRNQAMDVVASCAVKAGELQAKLDAAEKQIAELKAKLPGEAK